MRIQIQTNKIPWSILILTVHSKSYIHPTPLTWPLLYFGFCPQNPCKMRVFYIPLNMCFPYDNSIIPIYTQMNGFIFTFCFVILISSVTTLTLGSWPRQGVGRWQAMRKTRESLHMLPGVQRVWGSEPSHSQVNSHVGSWNPKRIFESSERNCRRSKLLALRHFIYHWKALEA
jgi:hypothetical protein